MPSIYSRHIKEVLRANEDFVSKYRLNLLELGLVAVYPLIVVLGQLVYLLNKMMLTNGPEETESDAIVGNYFTSKHNLINVIFVKQGWAWTSIIFLLVMVRVFILDKDHKRVGKAGIRYIASSIWWFFFTQWFFGEALMDRVFLATGGVCSNISHSEKLKKVLAKSPDLQEKLKAIELKTGRFLGPGPVVPQGFHGVEGNEEFKRFEARVSSAICRRVGGVWTGGYDPSGHCFLLVHSSLFLIFELIPVFPALLKDLHENNDLFALLVSSSEFLTLLVKRLSCTTDTEFEKASQRKTSITLSSFLLFAAHPLVAASLLLSLWAWMLLITSVYFHSLPELLAGTLAGYMEVLPMYIGMRFI